MCLNGASDAWLVFNTFAICSYIWRLSLISSCVCPAGAYAPTMHRGRECGIWNLTNIKRPGHSSLDCAWPKVEMCFLAAMSTPVEQFPCSLWLVLQNWYPASVLHSQAAFLCLGLSLVSVRMIMSGLYCVMSMARSCDAAARP